jgi:diacylglycerol O-acyltransferase
MTTAQPKAERLSREDTARWHMATPKNPMVIGALLRFEQKLTLEALGRLAVDKIIPHRRFRQHVVESTHPFGRPRWCDDPAFDLRAHVQALNPSRPVDADELIALAGERMNAPLPRDRSPWRLELVELTPGGSALLVRIHHCIADGRALVALLQELAEELPGAGPEQEREKEKEKEREKAAQRPASSGSPGRSGFFRRLGGLLRFLLLSGEPPGLLRRPLSGHKTVAWSPVIPLAEIKAIARASGHRVVDVLLAAVAGALDRYQRAHGQAAHSLRALLPVAAPAAASANRLGNHFASVFVRLPIADADPAARLETIARDLAALRMGGALRLALGLVRLAGVIAPAIEHWAVRWWSRRASLVVSSLAGPTVPLRVAGQVLRSIIVWAPAAASVGLSLTFFGYAGELHLGVLADDAVIGRPEELVAAFEAALDDVRRGALPDNR